MLTFCATIVPTMTTTGDDSSNSGDDSEPDNTDAPDAAYEQLEARILQGAAQNSGTGKEDDDVDSDPLVLSEAATSTSTAPDSVELPPDPTDPYPSGTTVQVYWEGEKKWYTGNITKTDVWRGPNGLSKQPRRQIHISYDDGVDKVHSLHNTKVRTVVTDEAETGVEEVSVAAGTSGSSTGVQFDMPPSWPNSPVNTPRPQPDPPSQPPGNGTAPAAAAPSPPSNQPGTPQTMNNSAKSVGAYVWLRPRRGAERRATAGALLGFSFTRLKRQRT